MAIFCLINQHACICIRPYILLSFPHTIPSFLGLFEPLRLFFWSARSSECLHDTFRIHPSIGKRAPFGTLIVRVPVAADIDMAVLRLGIQKMTSALAVCKFDPGSVRPFWRDAETQLVGLHAPRPACPRPQGQAFPAESQARLRVG